MTRAAAERDNSPNIDKVHILSVPVSSFCQSYKQNGESFKEFQTQTIEEWHLQTGKEGNKRKTSGDRAYATRHDEGMMGFLKQSKRAGLHQATTNFPPSTQNVPSSFLNILAFSFCRQFHWDWTRLRSDDSWCEIQEIPICCHAICMPY